MEKMKILFPFVEAGFGHIMAEEAICSAFEKKYSDYFEIIRCNFFKDYGEPMLKFEKRMCDEVKRYNKCVLYGYINIAAMNITGRNGSKFVMEHLVPGTYADCMKRMEEISPDVVISTHWATNYYAEHMKNKPYTVMYGPDAHLNKFFRYPCDLDLISIPFGYERAKKFKKRFNDENLKLVPTAIRKEAFETERDKAKLRQKLGLKDKFTVIVMDGGYGVGLTEKLSHALIKENLPINVIAVCGKNPELYDRLKDLKGDLTDFYPLPFCQNILEYISASDLYFGKSGSGILEPAFFNVPIVVTHSANTIEKFIADHYIKYVGDAIRIESVKKCVNFVKDTISGGEQYNKLLNSTDKLQKFGGDGIADVIFESLDKRFHLTETKDNSTETKYE